ncbi:hypothetical protein PV797_18355 [Clostridiaceae bacterium M8S5]|nr:hypothetical protein PV797_18355 [Clostridiaceae bacterium M8S5]
MYIHNRGVCYQHFMIDNSIDPFPPINPDWFAGGLPDSIQAESSGLSGDTIDFVPIDIIAKVSKDNVSYGVLIPEAYKYDGYVDVNNVYHDVASGEIFKGSIYPGLRIATIFVKKGMDPLIDGCKVHGRGKWVLLSDFGGIDPGSTASKTISYTHGVNQTDTQSLAFTVGAKVGGSYSGMTGELSASLTATFGTSISISEEFTVSDTVNFQAQDKEQRIGAYQFYRNFYVEPGPALRDKIAKDQTSSFAFAYAVNKTFDYKTNHFQKVFVLEP